jgi:hypothetical protein
MKHKTSLAGIPIILTLEAIDGGSDGRDIYSIHIHADEHFTTPLLPSVFRRILGYSILQIRYPYKFIQRYNMSFITAIIMQMAPHTASLR